MRKSRTSRRIGALPHLKAPRPTLRFEDIAAMVGEQKTIELCYRFRGSRIPSPWLWLTKRRAEAIVRSWGRINHAASVARFYGVSPVTVRRIIRRHREKIAWRQEHEFPPTVILLADSTET